MDGRFFMKNGKCYARVSTILEKFSDWKGDAKANVARANKALLGTAVHHAIDERLSGRDFDLNERESKYFYSYKLWEKMFEPNFLEHEERYFDDDLMITGAIDGVFVATGYERPTIVDYKTSVTPSKTWPMQAHFYWLMASKKWPNINRFVVFCQLTEGNHPKVHTYNIQDNMINKCILAAKEFWEI